MKEYLFDKFNGEGGRCKVISGEGGRCKVIRFNIF